METQVTERHERILCDLLQESRKTNTLLLELSVFLKKLDQNRKV